MMFQDLATWKEMNIQTDGYEEEGEYLHGRDTFNYFSDIFHISHGPHEGEKYQDLTRNSNTLSTKIFLFGLGLLRLIDDILPFSNFRTESGSLDQLICERDRRLLLQAM